MGKLIIRSLIAIRWSLPLVGVLFAFPELALAEEKAEPLVIQAVRVSDAPLLVGNLEDACWQEATKITDFLHLTTAEPP